MPSFESIVKPSDSRAAYYDGPDLDRAYAWACPSCGSKVDVNLGTIQRAAWSWRDEIPDSLAAELKAHFRIGSERAHGGGWVSLLIHACPGCGTKFALYSSVDEYLHSAYRVHIQDLARVAT